MARCGDQNAESNINADIQEPGVNGALLATAIGTLDVYF
jgi:hypothetical protein